jgi:hypothetical protein
VLARRPRQLLAAAALASGVLTGGAAPALAAPAADAALLTVTTPAMDAGGTAWVSVTWGADNKTLTDFTVTATAPAGVTVGYPAGRRASSLYGSSTLVKRTEDFTALQVSVAYGRTGSVVLPLHATWSIENGAGKEKSTGSLDGSVTIPLKTYTGPALQLTTTSVQVPKATPTWVDLRVTGAAPSLTDVRVTVGGPAGLVVGYPADGAFSGLDADALLLAGESDRSGVRLDASALPPGTYPLTVTVAYTGAIAGTFTGGVSLRVS